MNAFEKLVRLVNEDDLPMESRTQRAKRERDQPARVVLNLNIDPIKGTRLELDVTGKGATQDFLPGVATQLSGRDDTSMVRRSLDDLAQGILDDLARRGMEIR